MPTVHDNQVGSVFVVAGFDGGNGVVSYVISESPHAVRKAVFSCGGNVFLRRCARSSIPLQALALKKYRCGTPPASKTSDNEDAAAALGHSEVLSVKNSVGEPIPELPQPCEEGGKIPPSV